MLKYTFQSQKCQKLSFDSIRVLKLEQRRNDPSFYKSWSHGQCKRPTMTSNTFDEKSHVRKAACLSMHVCACQSIIWIGLLKFLWVTGNGWRFIHLATLADAGTTCNTYASKVSYMVCTRTYTRTWWYVAPWEGCYYLPFNFLAHPNCLSLLPPNRPQESCCLSSSNFLCPWHFRIQFNLRPTSVKNWLCVMSKTYP